MNYSKKIFIFLYLIFMVATISHAGVIVGGTRIIYDANKKEVSLSVKNPDNSPYLIQSWIDNSSEKDSKKPPFIITPPLFRLNMGQENLLRIIYIDDSLPTDRESVFWLNIKSIAATDKKLINRLQISVRTRIKLFFRPAKLDGNPQEAYKRLTFVHSNGLLTITNPTPYFVSFYSLHVGKYEINNPGMIAPKSTTSLPLSSSESGTISWKAITDYGGTSETAQQ